MLINLRNALMAGKRPPFQCELEYLEGTGTQWIDTGVNAFNWPYLEITCKVNQTYINAEYQRGIIGNSNGGSRWQGIAPGGNSSVSFRGYDNATTISESVTADFITLVSDGPNRMAYAGQSSATLLSGQKAGDRYGIWAYVGRVAPIAMSVASVKIGISRDNLLFDGIPVLDWNGNAKMFDRVTGTYPTHYGTFVAGPEIHPVEYIESHGTEYIDTKFTVDNTCGYSATFMPLVAQDGIIIGTKGSGDSRMGISGVPPQANISWNQTLIISGMSVNVVHNIELNYMNNRKRILDGDEVAPIETQLSSSASTYNVCLFAGYWGSSYVAYFAKVKMYNAKISKDSNLVRNYKAIRVGSGSTWEGALLDTVERKVYRNAGTGAFTYGNDLKYPIPSE